MKVWNRWHSGIVSPAVPGRLAGTTGYQPSFRRSAMKTAQLRADAGVPAEKAGQAQQHRAPHHLLGQRRADARGAPDEDRSLQRQPVVGGDRPAAR